MYWYETIAMGKKINRAYMKYLPFMHTELNDKRVVVNWGERGAGRFI